MSTLTLSCTADQLLPSKLFEDDYQMKEERYEDYSFNEGTDMINFSDQMLDFDFVVLQNSSSSSLSLPLTMTHPVIHTTTRKRPNWKTPPATDDSPYKKKLDKDDKYIDIMYSGTSGTSGSDSSTSTILSSSGYSSDNSSQNYRSAPYCTNRYHGNNYHGNHSQPNYARNACYTNANIYFKSVVTTETGWKPSYSSKQFIHCSPRSSLCRQDEVDLLNEKLKQGRLSAREEMCLLKLSCICQSRNTGKITHLWEFLLELLADKRMKSVIAWTGHAREFKVVNSREVAREWGNRKNKPHMNFDKMSRAMRYYYKKKILTHGNKQRLVYSFSKDAICPHYEKIVKLALKTRPNLQDEPESDPSSPEQCKLDPITLAPVRKVWNISTSPKVTTSTFQKQQSDKFLTEKLSSQRLFKKSAFRSHPTHLGPPKPYNQYNHHGPDVYNQQSRPRVKQNVRTTKLGYPTFTKIKIPPRPPSNTNSDLNDCFKFKEF